MSQRYIQHYRFGRHGGTTKLRLHPINNAPFEFSNARIIKGFTYIFCVCVRVFESEIRVCVGIRVFEFNEN